MRLLAGWLLVLSEVALGVWTFSPPQVYKNTNLLRTIDITKGYVRDTVAVIIENTSDSPQTEYYVPVPKEEASAISYFEAKDKKEGTVFTTELVVAELDRYIL